LIAQQAVRGIAPQQIELARLLQLGWPKMLVAIVLPAITPRLFTAFRLSASLALVVAVTVEIFGNPQGLGYAIAISEQNLDPALSLAMLLWVGVIGYLLNLLLVAGQNRLFLPRRDVVTP
jgi:NitT/TauT family transport system permease protein